MKSSFFNGLQNKIVVKEDVDSVLKICTDTRKISAEDFYLPLKGANFNGEDFISTAIENGAIGFLTTNIEIAESYKNDPRVKLIAVVPNTLHSYMELAQTRIKELGCKVIGITGSSGKTTVKEMIATVVSQKYNTHKTNKNYNNEVGFCQTVFEAPDKTEVLILEMGMRGLGEIELISKYANIDIAVITNVGTAHIGRLGSRENIAIAKSEITKFLDSTGIVIAPNDELVKKTMPFQGRKIYFDIQEAKVLSEQIGETIFSYKEKDFLLPIEGSHNISNSLIAINVGELLNIPYEQIKEGLRSFKTIENRWNIEKVNGFNIINDCYNANPESMKATIDTVLRLYKNPVLILGDMGELGENSSKYHKEIGAFIKNNPLAQNTTILTVGNLAKNINLELEQFKSMHFTTNEDVADYLLKNKNVGNILFLKASRSMKFEQIINQIKGDFE